MVVPDSLLVDVTDTLLTGSRTGVQRVVIEMARVLQHRVGVTLVRFHHWKGLFLPLTPDETDRLFSPVSSRTPKRAHRATWRRARRLVAFLVDALRHVVQALFPRPQTAASVYLTAEIIGDRGRVRTLRAWQAKTGLRLAFVVHDLFPLTHPAETALDQSDFLRYLDLVKGATAFPVSEETERELKVHGIGLRTHRLLPGTSVPSLAAVPKAVDPLFVCVGTIEPRKNQATLLEVVATLWSAGEKFQFVFVGTATSESGDFAHRVRELQAQGFPLKWLSPATEAELEELYRRAWATVYVSRREGYGLPVVESLARGTPCIVSDSGALGQTARHLGGCHLVSADKPEEWQDALRRLAASFEKTQTLAQSIRFDRLLSWDSYVDNLLNLLEAK